MKTLKTTSLSKTRNDASPTLLGELKKHFNGCNYITIDNVLMKERKIRKMIAKEMFQLVLVWVRHEEPGNYTYLILLPRNYSLIANSGTNSNFEIRNIAYGLLVVSTVRTYISNVKSLRIFLQFLLFIFPFATSDKMSNCHYYVYISCLINSKIQYHITCLISDPLSITLDIFILL